MPSETEWVFPTKSDDQLIQQICKDWKISPMIADILIRRGYNTPQQIQSFIKPNLAELIDPYQLRHMDLAVDLLTEHIIQKKRIVILGDYDVDGITATCLMIEFLRSCEMVDLDFFIPNRIHHGYGLTEASTDILLEMKPDLVVTVDNGITARQEVKRLIDAKVEVIITDHHLAEPSLIPECCVVNPNHPQCVYPFKKISGCGVALKLIMAQRKKFREMDWWNENRPEPNLRHSLDLAALGTVADVVPLVGENRILTHHGLKVMNQNPRMAFKVLKKLKKVSEITSRTLGFQFAPLLNAAGRLEDADIGVDLLLHQNQQEAENIADKLNHTNLERREKEAEMLETAITQAEKEKDAPALIVKSSSFHEGINGIVATRLMNRYYKPILVFSECDEKLKGSGRSTPELHLKNALSHCSEELQRFGGHSAAAGCSLNKLDFEKFKIKFLQYCSENIPPNLKAKLHLEGYLKASTVTMGMVQEFEILAPFGEGNPEPVFSVETPESSFFPLSHKHVKWNINQNVEIIGWNLSEKFTRTLPTQLAVHLGINEFRGRKKVQLTIDGFVF